MITKKYLIAVGQLIKDARGTSDEFSTSQIHSMASMFRRHNPRFSRERWIGFVMGVNGPNGGAIRRRRL
jgi:hypothetical protein